MYDEKVLKILRQRFDLDENDKSNDEKLNNMSPRKVLSELVTWELGYSGWDTWFLNQMNAVGAEYSFPEVK